jgi:hypothetical protein
MANWVSVATDVTSANPRAIGERDGARPLEQVPPKPGNKAAASAVGVLAVPRAAAAVGPRYQLGLRRLDRSDERQEAESKQLGPDEAFARGPIRGACFSRNVILQSDWPPDGSLTCTGAALTTFRKRGTGARRICEINSPGPRTRRRGIANITTLRPRPPRPWGPASRHNTQTRTLAAQEPMPQPAHSRPAVWRRDPDDGSIGS